MGQVRVQRRVWGRLLLLGLRPLLPLWLRQLLLLWLRLWQRLRLWRSLLPVGLLLLF
jgi:hypothetical protein